MKKDKETKKAGEKPDSAKAVVKFVRIAPRKVRIVINAIRREHPSRAFEILMTFKKKAARMTEKLLKSAVANAKVLGLDEARLYIADIRADGGPVMKRFMQRSMGRANRIIKRTTHLQVTLKEGAQKGNLPLSPAEAKEEKETGRKKQAAAV